MSERTKNILLIGAAVLLAAALIISMDVAQDDPLANVVSGVNAFGYSFRSDDFYVLGGATDATIASLIAEAEGDISLVVEASRSCGFPADVEASGDITVLLAETDAGVLTLYLRDGAIELAFIQTAQGEILPLS